MWFSTKKYDKTNCVPRCNLVSYFPVMSAIFYLGQPEILDNAYLTAQKALVSINSTKSLFMVTGLFSSYAIISFRS